LNALGVGDEVSTSFELQDVVPWAPLVR
jgi:hypothetical protein